jgi:hypothetical protein
MRRRGRLAPTGVALVGTALIWTLALSACASGGAVGGGSINLSYGYMVPGPEVATALRVGATDTIPELTTRATLPTVLANAISQEVAQGNWNNQCTRRFGGPAIYALIFHRFCDSSRGPDADPVVVVGFSADGRTVGRVRWIGPSTVTLLVPMRRF